MADFPPAFDKNKHSFEGAQRVWIAKEKWTSQMVRAISAVLPPGVTISFNYEGDQAWFEASRPADTREVYQAALEKLGA
ncbi:hypothetical protein [Actinoplanes sp. NPDC089786]|uniref:hypothetical protein n=1 Tax=Actinoplanes sp. NPDC089786 TaxID=3155185 RepID=UPI00343C0C0A